MNLFYRLFMGLFCVITCVQADIVPATPLIVANSELPPLTIAIQRFEPPFIIQTSANKIYGFDVEMMDILCKIMNRTCRFQMMRFEQILPAVHAKKVDLAIGAIMITPSRAAQINFSLPYAISYSRFLANKGKLTNKPFSLAMLNGRKIGIEQGTVFAAEIAELGIKNPRIKTYPTNDELVENLSRGNVDFILLDNPTAIYWEANSSGTIVTLGVPYAYGFGYGIAVTPTDPALLNSINQALLKYETMPDYKFNYNKYFGQF